MHVCCNGTRTKEYPMKLDTIVTITFLVFGYNTWGQDSVNNSGQQFIIRDVATITKETNSPLYIIKTENGTMQIPESGRLRRKIFKNFNLDWISTVEVLKDNNATAIYGVLGQNGVVIINLKEGTYDKLPRRLRKYKSIK